MILVIVSAEMNTLLEYNTCMGLRVGIVGLPNVGKSTLFSAITKAHAEIANYPFSTIKSQVGSVAIDDYRLSFLKQTFNPIRTIHATLDLVDIAGLVKGASTGEGLGNQFLAGIRECDAIIHVVRAFNDGNVLHVANSIDPIRDIEVVDLELVIADFESLKRRYDKVSSKARINKEKEALFEMTILEPLLQHLEGGNVARSFSFTEDQRLFALSNYQLITLMPTIYVANVSDADISDLTNSQHYIEMERYLKSKGEILIPLSLNIELEISQLDEAEKKEFLSAYGLETSSVNRVARVAYDLLNLATFFTSGKDECRAWTFRKGMLAPQCAGVIHTDFERGFIRADVYTYDEFKDTPDEIELRKLGKIRSEGKKYEMKDGDIVFFKFNV